MPNWVDEQIARQRFEDIARAEQRHQLIKQLAAARPEAPHFYGPLLAGLGRRLVIWGIRLEERYSVMIDPAIAGCNGDPYSSR